MITNVLTLFLEKCTDNLTFITQTLKIIKGFLDNFVMKKNQKNVAGLINIGGILQNYSREWSSLHVRKHSDFFFKKFLFNTSVEEVTQYSTLTALHFVNCNEDGNDDSGPCWIIHFFELGNKLATVKRNTSIIVQNRLGV